MTTAAAIPVRSRFFVSGEEELWSARVDALDASDPLVAKCAAIEQRAWRPREPFEQAFRRSDHLLWSSVGEELRAFVLVSFHPSRSADLGISIDEAMVEPSHVGEHVVSRIFWSAACGATAFASARRHRRLVFYALTSSARLIAAFYKYRLLVPDHSVPPRPGLVRAAAH